MKVSIIIPCYNSEKYIDKCINSIINQTYNNWEAIIVDDGSNDNSYEMLKQYSEKNEKIKIISQRNYGPSIARNNAIKYSNGHYLMFVDSDDYIHENMIEELIKYAKIRNSDIVTCGYYEIKDSNLKPINNFINNKIIDSRQFLLEKILLTSGGVIWGKLYRSEIIKKNNILFNPDIKICEDQLFNIEILSKSSKIDFMEKNLYFYNLNNNFSLTSTSSINNINNQILVQRLLRDRLNNLNLYNYKTEEILGRRLYNHIYNFIYFYIKSEIYSINSIKNILNEIEVELYLKNINLESVYDRIIRYFILKKSVKCIWIIFKLRILVSKLIKRVK